MEVLVDSSITNIILEIIIEEDTVLWHDGNSAAEVLAAQSAYIVAINCDLSGMHIVEAVQ